jgi:very-short-patch-repair endonuclease
VVEGNVVVVGESLVLAVAGRQHGVISAGQIARAGLSAGWIRNRVHTGWLQRLHRGVYLAGPLESPYSRLMAAALAAGPGALISHCPAAVLWELSPPAEGPIDVTVPRKIRGRPGITAHRAILHPSDVTRRHGIPATSAARTVLDLAASSTMHELDRALNEAQVHHRVSAHSLNEQFSRYPRHRGTAALKKALRNEPRLTRSTAERLMLALIRKAELPTPQTNVRVEGHEVDLVWHPQRLVAEFDSWAFHSMRRSFEQDRRRDQRLVAAGWRIVRITWRQMTAQPEAVVATLATALAA